MCSILFEYSISVPILMFLVTILYLYFSEKTRFDFVYQLDISFLVLHIGPFSLEKQDRQIIRIAQKQYAFQGSSMISLRPIFFQLIGICNINSIAVSIFRCHPYWLGCIERSRKMKKGAKPNRKKNTEISITRKFNNFTNYEINSKSKERQLL